MLNCVDEVSHSTVSEAINVYPKATETVLGNYSMVGSSTSQMRLLQFEVFKIGVHRSTTSTGVSDIKGNNCQTTNVSFHQ